MPIRILGPMLAALLVLVGCSDPAAHASSRDPQAVARDFLTAVANSDEAAMAGLLTEAARKALADESGFKLSDRNFTNPEVGDASVTGQEADVKCSISADGERQDLRVLLRRGAGHWQVYGVAMTLGEGQGEMTIDFERTNALMQAVAESMGQQLSQQWEQAQREQTAREIAQRKASYDSLRSMTALEFRRSYEVATDVRGKSGSKAIELLAGQMHLTVHVDEHTEALSQSVGRDVRGLSCLEAVEMLCSDHGLHAVFPSVSAMIQAAAQGSSADPETHAIRLKAGPRAMPVTFVGPFAITVSKLEQHAPYGRGSLQINTQSHGLEPGVLGLFSQLDETVRLGAAVNDQGANLMAQDGVRYVGGGLTFGNSFEDDTQVDLKNLLRGVSRITRVDGTRHILLPLQVEEARFDTLTKGATAQLGSLEARIVEVGESVAIDFTAPGMKLDELVVLGFPMDDEGNGVQVYYEDSSSWSPDKMRYQLQAAARPASLRIKVVTARQVLDYPFELENIPLPRHEEMPESIEKLSMGTHAAPLSVTFERFVEVENQFPQARLKVQNHSNKDVLSLNVQFHYLDGAGKTIEAFPHTITAPPSFDGPSPMVKAETADQVDTTAFFRPDTARGVRVTIESVEFMDASVWAEGQD